MALIQPLYLILLMVLVPISFAIHHYLGPKYDPREPPIVQPNFPFLGHIIGLISYGLDYFERVSKKHNLPILTLPTLAKRIYVVCSLDLVLAVQKDTKRLPLNPFIASYIPRIFDIGKEDLEAITLNHDSSQGDWGFLPDTHHKSFSTLTPGSNMDWMLQSALGSAINSLNLLQKEAKNGKKMNLWGWTSKTIGLASTESVYGTENPFKHEPELLDDFWCYEGGLIKLLMSNFPKFFAYKAHMARVKISSAMYSYYSRNGQEQASAFLQARHDVGRKNGVSLQGISSLELGDCLAVLVNTTPAVFWMIWHIYSTPVLLQELRNELTNVLRETIEEDGRHINLNVAQLKTKCPLFFSTYQETLRVRTHSAAHRWVMEDTLISDRFLMKKGNAVFMPGHLIHANPSVWGSDVNCFNPRRFMKAEGRIKVGSLRTFGGGKALCPGRHLATMKIMSFVAMMVVRFDIAPAGKGWIDPQSATGKMVSIVNPPASDIKTIASVREGYGDVQWEFEGVGEGRATDRFDVTLEGESVYSGKE